MKDLKEESSQLGYGNQWSEVKAEIAKPAAKEHRHCETPGCVYEVTLPDRFCDVCERERHERLSHARSIPLCYQWATFDSAELPGRCGGTSMVAKGIAAIDALIAGKSPAVVLHGPAGSGKTSIAAAMLRRWLHKERGLFVDALDIGRCYRITRLGEAPQAMVKATAARCIVLDDVGGESPGGHDAVGELIHERHASGKPTIYTLGFDREELARMYGSGIARRIYDRAIVIAWPEAARRSGIAATRTEAA